MTIESNLAIACSRCNLHKGPNLAGIDPLSEALVRLFNPRIDVWTEHFHQALNGEIMGMSDIGRTTVCVLDMNDTRRVELRASIMAIVESE